MQPSNWGPSLQDVAWHNHSFDIFGSVGDDKQLIVWDKRQQGDPLVRLNLKPCSTCMYKLCKPNGKCGILAQTTVTASNVFIIKIGPSLCVFCCTAF